MVEPASLPVTGVNNFGIAVGTTCLVFEDGSVQCVGFGTKGQADSPAGLRADMITASAAAEHLCARRVGSQGKEIMCWVSEITCLLCVD